MIFEGIFCPALNWSFSYLESNNPYNWKFSHWTGMTRRALLCSLCRVIRVGCVASFVFSKLGLFYGSDYSKMISDMCFSQQFQ